MKKNLILNIIAVLALFTFSFVQKKIEPCNIVELRKASKPLLTPYNYDSQLLKRITFKNPITLETEIPLSFFGEYRLVLNTDGMPVKVPINIYNKEKQAKKRELLWSNESYSETDKIMVYTPQARTRRVFVDIEVPADSLNQKTKGCIYMTLGYK